MYLVYSQMIFNFTFLKTRLHRYDLGTYFYGDYLMDFMDTI